ncbi:DUF2225 domain-containing protein [Paenibacillus herberti]|uniref:DUF2225 domain-containing protein n=1 Tax=Paenibacillus herberti TaxID=1619309 RepID=A0A229P5X1_9BACL|nr:DUF2225 domain-containing protein [Paenibacillus herberti]OXM17305.1 hypothetical protein CGZ75_12075 [Paenibacillus herberti]
MEPLYETEITCPYCDMSFLTSRVRSSFKRAKAVDSDFCGYYKAEVNPDFYVVRVCPQCGFSTTENSAQSLRPDQKQTYFRLIGTTWKPRHYAGSRTREQALECYKLALMSAQAIGDKERLIAGMLHHLAWLYRYGREETQERRFLRHALDAYQSVFENEHVDNDAKLMYLIGELHRRLDEPREAVRWFSRVVQDRSIIDTAMIQASRRQWQLIREQAQEVPEWMMDSEGNGSAHLNLY